MLPIGGEGPRIRTLYHYSQSAITGPIRPRQFWTDFQSDSPDDVSRVTGTAAARLCFRSEVRVNEDAIDGTDPWFTNEATKMVPGLGAYDEYLNRKPIDPRHLSTVAL